MTEDIPEKVDTEAAHRQLLDQLPHFIFRVDAQDRYTAVNAATCRFFGREENEILGKTAVELGIDPELARLWTDQNAKTRDGGTPQTLELTLPTRSGTQSHRAITTPVRDWSGGIIGVSGVSVDTTELKTAAEERRRLDERMGDVARLESLGTLAGGMAHDFNNILSIILTHMTLLERKHDDPAIVARVMKTVREAVQRGAALTRQILTFAQRGEAKPEPVDFTQLIIELGSMIAETFPPTVQVTLDLDPDLPLATADAGQMHQALLNLCVNARDAMPDGGELTIEANLKSAASLKEWIPDARAKDYIVISVVDTGTGIDEETRRRIFEPFFTTKEKGKGTGLGLALVYGVVNNHGGRIDVESKVGEGTSFHLYLPLTPYAPVPAIVHRERAAGVTETLLVIEDEPELRDSVSMQLRARGYDVRTAENGVDAITKCKSADGLPDAVIMDLGMPRMSATDLLAALRALAPGLPIVAMTGYAEPDVHAGVVAAGVRKIVQKPFEMEELLVAIRDVL